MSRPGRRTLAKGTHTRLCNLINAGEITGARGLAATVIGQAVNDGDEEFFGSEDGQFWADLAELNLGTLCRYMDIPDAGNS